MTTLPNRSFGSYTPGVKTILARGFHRQRGGHRIAFEMSPRVFQRLKRLAITNGESLSATVRNIVNRHLIR